ncbi:MAG: type II toxin-antitoxin system HicA family toxin [Bacteroidota bacterium]
MPKLRKVSGEETIRVLEQLGFLRVRQRGSHVILKQQTAIGYIGCVVPLHKELKIGTLLGILKQAKVDPEDFSRLL